MSKSGNLAALAAILEATDPPTLYYAEDPPYLPRVLVFYWPVQTAGSTTSASRIRTTILSAAGFKSFGSFQVSPSSSYYSAVHKLPEDKQRDDVCRGLAFGLFRYFSEISPAVKTAITDEHAQHGIGLKWGQTHAAQIACRLGKVINSVEVVEALRPFAKRPPSPVSASPKPVVPHTSIRKTRPSFLPPDPLSNTSSRPGQYTPSRRVPLAQARRTPSYTMQTPRKSPPVIDQKQTTPQMEALRFQMCEFVDTEDRYVSRLQELTQLVVTQGRTPKSLTSKFSSSKDTASVNAMIQFPSLLDELLELNIAFLDDVRDVLDKTDESAMACFASGSTETSQHKDPLGAHAFAKVLSYHFPKFLVPYREYLDIHSKISSNLGQYLKEGTYSVQQAPSLLMEPAQRISRYSLYIDSMTPNLGPAASVTAKTFEKARKIIAEICDMEPAASTILDSLRIEHEDTRSYRPLSPQKLLTLSGLRSGGTVREAAPVGQLKDTPRMLPSLGRSFSRKTKSATPAKVHLGERAVNRGDENVRPETSGSEGHGSLKGSRPNTGSSAESHVSCGISCYSILVRWYANENVGIRQSKE
jgi:hypothetical protein